MQPSIIIADDHPLVLKGLQDYLNEKGYNILASAGNGRDAYELILKHQPDIAILDIQMPYMTGLEIAEKCHSEQLDVKIVLITFEKDKAIFLRAKELKVYGYVLKEFALAEIENCIQSVLKRTPYFSPDLIENLDTDDFPEGLDLLTPTEKKVLRHVAQNKTTRDIADELFISNRTVEKHRSNIIKKLELDQHQNSLLIWAKENQSHLI